MITTQCRLSHAHTCVNDDDIGVSDEHSETLVMIYILSVSLCVCVDSTVSIIQMHTHKPCSFDACSTIPARETCAWRCATHLNVVVVHAVEDVLVEFLEPPDQLLHLLLVLPPLPLVPLEELIVQQVIRVKASRVPELLIVLQYTGSECQNSS